MRDKKKFQVYSEKDQSPNSELHGEDLVQAAAVNLLITAALIRSSLQVLYELLHMPDVLSSSDIRVMEAHMQFASSVMGLNLIPSSFALRKTWDFSLTGSLKISSDEIGLACELIDTELEVKGHSASFDLMD